MRRSSLVSAAVTVLLVPALSGCGFAKVVSTLLGNGPSPLNVGGRAPQVVTSPRLMPTASSKNIEAALCELDALPCPDACGPEKFNSLKDALRVMLEARLDGKATSVLPDQGKNAIADAQVVDDGAGGFNLTWTYRNVGDYGVNGEVGIADLTPLGANLNKTSASPDWDTAQVADGDGNGVVSISDITPIGANFGAQIAGYNIYGGPSDAGPWTLVGEVPFSAGGSGTPRPFNYSLGQSPAYAFYSVTPHDGELADWLSSQGGYLSVGSIQPGSVAVIDSAGGSLDGPAGTPLEGVHIDVAAGALPDGTNVMLDYNDGSVTPADGVWTGPIIELSTDFPNNEFDAPITITQPYSLPADYLPVPYYVTDAGDFECCQITNIDESAGTYSFATSHASRYITVGAAVKDPPRPKYSCGFEPADDGFQVFNDSSPYTGGACWGESTFCSWYYRVHAWYHDEPSFYSEFMYDVNARKGQHVIATRAQISVRRKVDQYKPLVEYQKSSLTARQILNMIKNMILNMGSPVTIHLESSSDKKAQHAVLAYAFDGDALKMWDSNAPAPLDFFTPDITVGADDKFQHYHPGSTDYDGIMYLGVGSFKVAEPYQQILDAAKDKFKTVDATLDVTSPPTDPYTTDKATYDIMVKCHSGQVLVDHIYYHAVPKTAALDKDGNVEPYDTANELYKITVPLKRGLNEIWLTPYGYNEQNALVDLRSNLTAKPLSITRTTASTAPPVTLTLEALPPQDELETTGEFELYVQTYTDGSPIVFSGAHPTVAASGTGLTDQLHFVVSAEDLAQNPNAKNFHWYVHRTDIRTQFPYFAECVCHLRDNRDAANPKSLDFPVTLDNGDNDTQDPWSHYVSGGQKWSFEFTSESYLFP